MGPSEIFDAYLMFIQNDLPLGFQVSSGISFSTVVHALTLPLLFVYIIFDRLNGQLRVYKLLAAVFASTCLTVFGSMIVGAYALAAFAEYYTDNRHKYSTFRCNMLKIGSGISKIFNYKL